MIKKKIYILQRHFWLYDLLAFLKIIILQNIHEITSFMGKARTGANPLKPMEILNKVFIKSIAILIKIVKDKYIA